MSARHRYYPALDGARAVAALLVLIFHAAQEGLPLPSVVSFGQTGVDLFFVLSGFLITSILLGALPGDWGEVRTFYLRRSVRIFPLYYLCLTVCALFIFRCDWPYWVYLQNLWRSAPRPLDGPVHLWSLAVEEQFYLVWPFLVLFVPRRFLLTILAATIVLSIPLRYVLASHHHDVYSFTPTRLDALAAGAILATLHARGELHRWRSFLLRLSLVSAVWVLTTGTLFRNENLAWFIASKYSFLAAMYTGLIGWLICSPEAIFSRLLAVRPLREIGRVSYGLYIWHPFVFAIVFRLMGTASPWAKALISFPVAFLVAMASWYGFECHVLKLKDRIAPEPRYTPEAVQHI